MTQQSKKSVAKDDKSIMRDIEKNQIIEDEYITILILYDASSSSYIMNQSNHQLMMML